MIEVKFIFGVDVRSSLHIDNKKKDILNLGKDPTQGLENTTLTTEAEYSGCVYNFSVDYNIIDTVDIINIRKYLRKKHDIK